MDASKSGYDEYRDDDAQESTLLHESDPFSHNSDSHTPPSSKADWVRGTFTTDKPKAGVGAKFHHLKDLDKFFENAYTYYHQKGLNCVLFTTALNHISLLFVALVFLVLFGCVDYDALYNHIHSPICPNETENVNSLFEIDCFGNHPIALEHLHVASSYFWMCFVTFMFLWAFEMTKFIVQIPHWLEMKVFFEQVLRISGRDLQTISWDSVLEALVQAQRNYKLCITVDELDQVDIVNMICRNDNYYVAMMQTGWFPGALTLYGQLWFSVPLQWNIIRCINSVVFTEKHSIHEAIKNGSDADRRKLVELLQKRFKIYALCNILMAPFILVIRIAYFCFENSDEWKAKPSTLGLRRWTPYATWLLRDYNEVDHIFENRLRLCYDAAVDYVSIFVSEFSAIFAKFVVFILGGLFLLILVFSFVFDDELLVATFIWGRSVGWWFAVLGIALAIARSLIPSETLVFAPKQKMHKLQKNAHYFHKFEGVEGRLDTYEKFSSLFNLKLVVFLEEIIGFLLNPILLFFTLPSIAPQIIAFYKDNTTTVQGVGDICSNALFKQQARMIRDGYASGISSVSSGDSIINVDFNMKHKGKVLASMVHFKETHPTWKPDADSQAMFNDLQGVLDQSNHHDELPAYQADVRSQSLQESILILNQTPSNSDNVRHW